MSATQSGVLLVVSLLVFAFLGGPFWSASREAFPLRLFASYAIIPVLVAPVQWWNGVRSWWSWAFASGVIGAVKFAVTVVVDVAQGLFRQWPP